MARWILKNFLASQKDPIYNAKNLKQGDNIFKMASVICNCLFYPSSREVKHMHAFFLFLIGVNKITDLYINFRLNYGL